MINIVINNECLALPSLWEELPLLKAQAIKNLIALSNIDPQDIENEDVVFDCLLQNSFLDQIIHLLASKTNSNENQVELNTKNYYKYLWDNSLARFVMGLCSTSDYQITNIEYFYNQGQLFRLPKIFSIRQFVETKQISSQQLCEMNDLYAQNPLSNAPLITAVLCGKKNCSAVAENLAQMNMNIVFEVFYIVCQINLFLSKLFPLCYGPRVLVQSENSKPQSILWEDLLIAVSSARPSEVAFLRKQSCVDFMQLLDFKLKKFRL